MQSWKTIAVFCAVFCRCYCADRNNQSESRKPMNEVMGSIGGFLELETWEDKCNGQNKGGQAGQVTLYTINAKVTKFMECVFPFVNTLNEHDIGNITNFSDRPTLQLLINKICGGFPTIKKCLGPLVDAAQVCLTSTEKKNLNSILDAVFAGTDYACDNKGACSDKGARYIELLETGVEECVKSRDIGLSECKYKLSTNSMGNDMEELLAFNSNNCKGLSDARSCAVSKLKQCPNKRPAEIMGQFFGVVLQKLPCGFHFTSSAPTAVISNWMFTLVPFFAALAL